MSGIFGGKQQAKQTPAVTGLQIQTSAYGKVLPVVYGQTRIAPFMIWYANFQQRAHTQKVGKGGGSCFAAGTRVAVPGRGTVPIEELREDDPIWCCSDDGDLVEGRVSAAHKHETAEKMLRIRAGGRELHVTRQHYIYAYGPPTADGDPVPIMAEQLIRGFNELVSFHGETFHIDAVEDAPDRECTYNLTVDPHHTYFAEGLLVSNGGGGKTTSYTYTADLMFGLCEGVVGGIQTIWVDKGTQTAAALNFSSLPGSFGQATWTYLTTNYPTQAIGYSGIAWVGANPYDLGNNQNLPNLNFELTRNDPTAVRNNLEQLSDFCTGGPGGPSGQDMMPRAVIFDILSNLHYGLGFDDVVETESCTSICTIPQTPTTVTFTIGTGNQGNGCSYLVGFTYPDAGQYPAWDYQVLGPGGVAMPRVDINTDVFPNFDPGAGNYSSWSTSSGENPGLFELTYYFSAADIGKTVTIQYYQGNAYHDYNNFCQALGFWISPAYTEQRTGAEVLQEIAKFTLSEFIWSSGCLQIKPRSDGQVAVFDLTDDDYQENQGSPGSSGSGDPVQLVRKRTSDRNTVVQLEFLDRTNQYAPGMAIATDQSLVDRFGKRFTGSQQAHLFCDATAANVSAQMLLQLEAIRNNYYFTLDGRYIILDPMDIVTLTDSVLGLNKFAVRILEMIENDDGTINFIAEEYPTGIAAAGSYALNQGQGYTPNDQAAPGSVNAPIIFPLPIARTGIGNLTMALAISGASPYWGGCQVYISTDLGNSYTYVGQWNGKSRMGVTTADFPNTSNPDITANLSVDLTESAGTLTSGTTADADAGNTLCYLTQVSNDGTLVGEFVSYSTATLTSSYHYTLSNYIDRAQYGTAMADHPNGASFARVDGNLFTYAYTSADIGKTIYIKLCSFNLWGNALQSLAVATPYWFIVPAPFDDQPVFQQVAYGPDWTGATLSGFVKHVTGVIYPDSTVNASAMTDVQLWSTFVYSPVSNPTVTTAEIDTRRVTSVIVTESWSAYLGPGVAGPYSITQELDQWSTGSDPNTYPAWVNGSTTGEFFKGRLVENTSQPAAISHFQMTVNT
jgi:hypothetical protein